MKRLSAILLSVIFVVMLSACGVRDKVGGGNDGLGSDGSSAGTQNSQSDLNKHAKLTADEALDIALKDAGFKREEVSRVENHLDYDNGVLVYEIDFDRDAHEYSYEINAETGVIVDREKDIND